MKYTNSVKIWLNIAELGPNLWYMDSSKFMKYTCESLDVNVAIEYVSNKSTLQLVTK